MTPSGWYRLGAVFLVVGILLLAAGLLAAGGGRHLSWLGRLPGDIRIDRGNYHIRIPLASSLLLSAVLTAILMLWRRR